MALSHLILSLKGLEVLANLSIEIESVTEIEKEKGKEIGLETDTMMIEIEVTEGMKELMLNVRIENLRDLRLRE